MPKVLVLHATEDRPFVTSELMPLLQSLGILPTRCETSQGPTRSAGYKALEGFDWYVLILSRRALDKREVEWVMDHYPERALPVLIENCNLPAIHPRLDFLAHYDLRQPSDAARRALAQTWKREGIIRPRAGMPILMILSLKGGVAKTTNAVAVSECLADMGNRVLVIDTDHQCGAGALLMGEDMLVNRDEHRKTLADLFTAMLSETFDPKEITSYAVKQVSNIKGGLSGLSAIPCSLRIEDFWFNLSKAKRDVRSPDDWRRFLFNDQAAKVRKWLLGQYDYVIIDCPPAVAWQVRFFLRVADAFIVPAIPDRLSVRGARYLMTRIQNLGLKRIHPLATLWSIYREENAIHKNTVAKGVGSNGTGPALPEPFTTIIPNATAITRALEQGKHPKSFSDKYESRFAHLYRGLCLEIIERAAQHQQDLVPVG
jgi:chromosome partitioning protein